MDRQYFQGIFNAISLHLRGNYDFFKYQKKPSRAKKIFPHIAFIETKLENSDQLILYVIINQIEYYLKNGEFSNYFPNIISDEQYRTYQNVSRKFKMYDGHLEADLEYIIANGKETFSDFTKLIRMVYSDKLSIYSLVQIFKFMKVVKQWNLDDPLSQEFYSFLTRISPFLNFRKEKFIRIFQKVMTRDINSSGASLQNIQTSKHTTI